MGGSVTVKSKIGIGSSFSFVFPKKEIFTTIPKLEKIENEKARVTRDFTNARKQLEHVISDLETSAMAELDQIYKGFIATHKTFYCGYRRCVPITQYKCSDSFL